MAGKDYRTYVLTGDGEQQEGSMWEAAMAAAHYKLDKLVCIVDRNRLQQGDRTELTMALDPLPDKFRAFGWAVREVDGNDPAVRFSERSGLFRSTNGGDDWEQVTAAAEWRAYEPTDLERAADPSTGAPTLAI